ncbi:Acetylglutamate kinase [archaeon HR01]|nr:Acetylglutamate kinase [archaeon HR01]
MSDLVVLKLGGSVITDKSTPLSFRGEVMARIGREIARCWPTPLVVVHGGGSYGHPIAKEYSLDTGFREQRQLEGFVKTIQSMRMLNKLVTESLIEVGIGALGMPASLLFITNRDQIETAHLDIIFSSLDLGVIPVTCGDAVFDRSKRFTILSGDSIAVYLAKTLKARRLVFAVDVDGVYHIDRQTGRRTLLESLTYRRHETLLYRDVEDVTGGMFEKVETAFEASRAGVEVVLVNGLVEGRVEEAVKGGKVIGTRLVS